MALLFSQILFSLITPFLLIPLIAELTPTRRFIAFCFGRLYGSRYQVVIDSFQGKYGLAMAAGLAEVRKIAGDAVSRVVDCGTGTGYVTRQAAGQFPSATFIAFDILEGMLEQARDNCKDVAASVYHARADTFRLPLADGSADILLAQNTMPCFSEFARVLRPGGVVVYVDTAAGWIAGLAQRLVERHRLFEKVTAKKIDLGFYILARTRR
jgi:SAM-dependent methyltransferase